MKHLHYYKKTSFEKQYEKLSQELFFLQESKTLLDLHNKALKDQVIDTSFVDNAIHSIRVKMHDMEVEFYSKKNKKTPSLVGR